MSRIHVDRQSYNVRDGQNVLAACLGAGLDLPYFCWHPAMGSVGACRQCAVKVYKDEKDQAGRLVMACMTPVADGMRVSIEDADAADFRRSIIEWLMTNHPHDCPVCDEGGECHLQDMTVMTGHAYRRYRFPKRTYANQYLGPFIHHEMNRCIECYRCVRFYRDHAGGRDFNVFAAHNHVYFGRTEPGVLENEFSGNLVEVCPTGVFTDLTFFHHYSRKWDLQNAPSICVHCAVGCNTTPGERYGMLRRIVNRYHSLINGYFLCDRGRFGYEFVNSPRRITSPLIRPARGAALQPVDRETAVKAIAARLAQGDAIGIGSPRASLESNYALRKLVGADRFHVGIPSSERRAHQRLMQAYRDAGTEAATVRDIEESDAVFVLGEDLLNRAPRVALAVLQAMKREPAASVESLGIPAWNDAAVRQATNGRTGPLYIADSRRTWLQDYATESYYGVPDDLARLGFAVAHAVDSTESDVDDVTSDQRHLSQRIAAALKGAKQPVIISGTGSRHEPLLSASVAMHRALRRSGIPAGLALMADHCNSIGSELMGGLSLESAYEALGNGQAKTVIVLEQDLTHPAGKRDIGLPSDLCWIVLDHLHQGTTADADVVLPAATFAEGDGTLVNYEGRAQRHYQVYPPQGAIHESWRWLRDVAPDTWGWEDLQDVVQAMASELPAFQPILDVFPSPDFLVGGRKLPRQPERYSGRTAMSADRTIHEPPPPSDPDSPYAFTMEGPHLIMPAPLRPQTWAPRWNSNQALNKFQQEIGGALRDEVPGPLLIPDGAASLAPSPGPVPAAFRPRSGTWLALPYYALFGSDALSAAAEALSSRISAPALFLHPLDAEPLHRAAGERLVVRFDRNEIALPLATDSSVPRGAVGIAQWGGVCTPGLPAWCSLHPEAGGS